MRIKSLTVFVLIVSSISLRSEGSHEVLVFAPPYHSAAAFGDRYKPCENQQETTEATKSGNIELEFSYSGFCDRRSGEITTRASLNGRNSLTYADKSPLAAVFKYEISKADGQLVQGEGRHSFTLGFDLSSGTGEYHTMTCDLEASCSSQVYLRSTCYTAAGQNCNPSGDLSIGIHELEVPFYVDCAGERRCELPVLRTFAHTSFEYFTEYVVGSTEFNVRILDLTYSGLDDPLSPPPPRSTSKKLFGLGDSVAAGFGFLPGDGNSYSYPMQVLSSLGSSSPYTGANYAISGATSRQVLTEQMPKIINEDPYLVMLTVGADDIKFAQCAKAYVIPAENNPCTGSVFADTLRTLGNNLRRIFKLLGMAKVIVTEYYNPFPGPPSALEKPCDLFYVPAAVTASPLILASPGYNAAAMEWAARRFQTETWSYAEGVVQALNSAIREASAGFPNVTVVEIDELFAGHDACKSGQTAWVFGFEGVADFHFFGGTQHFAYSMPSPCPDPDRDPELWSAEGEHYVIELKINCAPHPTLDGQTAMANAVIEALS